MGFNENPLLYIKIKRAGSYAFRIECDNCGKEWPITHNHITQIWIQWENHINKSHNDQLQVFKNLDPRFDEEGNAVCPLCNNAFNTMERFVNHLGTHSE